MWHFYSGLGTSIVYRCKTRIVDSFGTEAEFNYKKFSKTNIKYESLWGNLELNLKQFMTMFRKFS